MEGNDKGNQLNRDNNNNDDDCVNGSKSLQPELVGRFVHHDDDDDDDADDNGVVVAVAAVALGALVLGLAVRWVVRGVGASSASSRRFVVVIMVGWARLVMRCLCCVW